MNMASSTTVVRRFFASRSVAVLFSLEIAFFIGAYFSNELGFESLSSVFGIVTDVAIFSLLIVSQLIPWSLIPELSLSGLALSAILFAAYLIVYYAIAVVAAVPVRSVNRLVRHNPL